MKVGGENTPIQLDAYQKQANQLHQQDSEAKQSLAAQQGVGQDKVQLSARALEVQQSAQALKEMPDVDEEKVQKVKMDVESGTYKVSGVKVATDMLKETFENNLILQKVNTRA